MDFDSGEFALTDFGRVLSDPLGEIEEPIAVGRDDVIEQIIDHVLHGRQASCLIVGPSGCGKTTVLHEVFRRLAHDAEEPWTILESSTSALMSGTRYLGEWQTKLVEMIKRVPRTDQNLIYFKDVASMSGVGTTSKSDENLATAMIPFLESGEVVLIGECNEEAYRRGIARHPSFARHFRVFRMEGQDDEAVDEILRTVSSRLAREVREVGGPEMKFSEESLVAARRLGRMYFPGIEPPGGAVRMVEAMVAPYIDPARGGDIPEHVTLEHSNAVRALEELTGLPGLLFDDARNMKLSDVRDFFDRRVLGQSEAVGAVVDLITLIKAGLNDPRKPLGVFLFVGPTGVGKTELAKALAEFIFGSPNQMIRFDMSEFKDYHSFEKWIGSSNPDGQGGRDGGLLSQVREQPFSVILLDEIEKAHANTFDVLLQLFDEGRLTDGRGITTDFTQTILIMTSNLGSKVVGGGSAIGFGTGDGGALIGEKTAAMLDENIDEAVGEHFRPEFLNRLDQIIRFRQLGREEVQTLARRELGQVLVRSGLIRRKLRVDVDPGVIDVLVDKGFDPTMGARPLKRAVQKLATLAIAKRIVSIGNGEKPALLRLEPTGSGIVVKTIHDRQSRRADRLERGIRVKDPIRQTSSRVTAKSLTTDADKLRDSVQALREHCSREGLAEKKSRIVEQTTKADFWDDPQRARELLGDMYRAERILEAVTSLDKRARDLQRSIQADSTFDEARLLQTAERIEDIRRHVEVLDFAVDCPRRTDRCDAFLSIRLIGDPDTDLTGKLADMYIAWAKRKGFNTEIVHEELFGDNLTRRIVLMIEGVAVHGILAGEDGTHEFVYGRTASSERETYHARVRVLPILDEDSSKRSPFDLTITNQPVRRAGNRIGRRRLEYRIANAKTGESFAVINSMKPDDAEAPLFDLFRADARRIAFERSRVDASTEEVIVRRYTMTPEQSARDLRTDVKVTNLRKVWRGDIDAFLSATIHLRRQEEDAAGS